MLRRWWPLAVLGLVAGLLRFAVAEATYPVRLRGDEVYYVRVAGEIAAGRGHVHPGPTQDRAKRPPLQAWVLSRFLDADWNATEEKALDSIHGLVRVEVVLGTLLVAMIYLLGRVWFGPRAGLVAGAIAVFEPTLVAYSHYLWSETLCALLLAAALLGVVRASRSGSWAATALGGLAFGLAALTREVALPVAIVCAGWLVRKAPAGSSRAALGRAAVLLGATAVVVLPWTWRNYRVFHRFVPISTIGWIALGEGNTLDPVEWFRKPSDVAAMRAEIAHGKDEIARNEIARDYTFRVLRAEQPAWIFKKFLRNTAIYLSPDSNLLMKLREGRYGAVSPFWNRFLEVASILSYVGIFALACVGIAADKEAGTRALTLAICAVILAMHVLTYAVSRYRIPWMPLLVVYASAAAVDFRGSIRRMTPLARGLAAAAILYFLAVCVPYHRDEMAALWECKTQADARSEAEGG